VQVERALTISEANLGPDHPQVVTRRNDLAGVLRELGSLQRVSNLGTFRGGWRTRA